MQKLSITPAFAAVVILGISACDASAQEVNWRHDYSAARKEAAETGRPLLFDFGYEGCVWCRKLDATTFRDPRIVKMLNERFIPVKIDIEREPRLPQAMGIESYPTLILASAEGKVLGRQSGYADVSQLSALLAKAPSAPLPLGEGLGVRGSGRPEPSTPSGPRPSPVVTRTAAEELLSRARENYEAGRYADSLRLCREIATTYPAAPETVGARRMIQQIASDPRAERQLQEQIAASLDALQPRIAAGLESRR